MPHKFVYIDHAGVYTVDTDSVFALWRLLSKLGIIYDSSMYPILDHWVDACHKHIISNQRPTR